MNRKLWLTSLALVVFSTTTAAFSLASGVDPGGGQGCPPGAPNPGCFIAPPIVGLPPIELPSGFAAPPSTTSVPGATLPPVLNTAEPTAVNAITGFQAAHPTATPSATDSVGASSFSLNVNAQLGGDFFSYTVPETATTVEVTYVLHDGTHSEILAAAERSTSGAILTSQPTDFEGALVDAQFDNNLLTTLVVTSEAAGVSTTYHFPEPPAGASAVSVPGLSLPGDVDALNTLVAAHLTGPAADLALNTFHGAQDQYFTLLAQVPEPTAAMLLITGAALAGGWSLNRRRTADPTENPRQSRGLQAGPARINRWLE
jgi:hypothetical protein